MNKLQKVISGVLITGLLATSVSGIAFAEEQTATAAAQTEQGSKKVAHQAGGKHQLFSMEQLQEQISDLPEDTQADILALAEQIQNIQPEKPTEQPAMDSDTMTQQKQLLEQIQAIFAEEGITLDLQPTMPDQKEKPEGDDAQRPERPDFDKENADGTKPEPPAKPDSDTEASDTDKAPERKGGKGQKHSMTTVIEEQLTQLSDEAQAEVQALLDELKALQPQPQEKPQSTDNEADSTMDTMRQLQDELTQLLKDNGVITDSKEKPADKPDFDKTNKAKPEKCKIQQNK